MRRYHKEFVHRHRILSPGLGALSAATDFRAKAQTLLENFLASLSPAERGKAEKPFQASPGARDRSGSVSLFCECTIALSA